MSYDRMSFAQAFRAARKQAMSGGQQTFRWKGGIYTTELKEEREARLRGRNRPVFPPPARPRSAFDTMDLQLNPNDFAPPAAPMGRDEALAVGMENYGDMPLSPGDETSMPSMRGEEPSGWMSYGQPRRRF